MPACGYDLRSALPRPTGSAGLRSVRIRTHNRNQGGPNQTIEVGQMK